MASYNMWDITDEKLEISKHIDEVYLHYLGDEVTNFVHGFNSVKRIRVRKYDHKYSCRKELGKKAMYANNEDIVYELPLDFDLILNYIITHVLEARPINLIKYIASLLEVCMERRQYLELQAGASAPSGGFNYYEKHKHKKSGLLLSDLTAVKLFNPRRKEKKRKLMLKKKKDVSNNEQTVQPISLDKAIEHMKKIECDEFQKRCRKHTFVKKSDSCEKLNKTRINKPMEQNKCEKDKNIKEKIERNEQCRNESALKLPSIPDSKKSNQQNNVKLKDEITSKETDFLANQLANNSLKKEIKKLKDDDNIHKKIKDKKCKKKIDFTKDYCDEVLKNHRKYWYEKRMRRKKEEQNASVDKRNESKIKKQKPKRLFSMEDSTSDCYNTMEKRKDAKESIEIEEEKVNQKKEIKKKDEEENLISGNKIENVEGEKDKKKKVLEEDVKKETVIQKKENNKKTNKKIEKNNEKKETNLQKNASKKLRETEKNEKVIKKENEIQENKTNKEMEEEENNRNEDTNNEKEKNEEKKNEDKDPSPFEIVDTKIAFDVIDAEFFEDPALLKQIEPMFKDEDPEKKEYLELEILGDNKHSS